MTTEHSVRPKAIYTRDDIAGIDHVDTAPGQAPYVRGIHASMYRGKPWTIRQYAGYSDAADSNLAFRRALAEGAQGLSVAFDLPTQRGYDSDDPVAHADVGMAGVAIDTVEDMARLFEGIPLDRVSVSMTMNGAVLPVLAAFIVAAEESGVEARDLRGTIQNDILKEYLVRNTYVFAPEASLRITADVATWLANHSPHFNALSVSGYHFQEAGADTVLELALTFANASLYVRTLIDAGMSPDQACEGLSFFFGVGKDFFTEIAKLRAARLIWSEIAQGLGASTRKACALRMHCQTSGWSLTAQQVDNNVVRTTVEAMAAIFGGTQSLHTNAFDEALCLPSADASRLARDTQLILQHEMGLCDVVDPWAGSFMMESLTDETARKVREKLNEIERRGGMLEAIGSGWIRDDVGANAARVQAAIDAGERVIVGSNRFTSDLGGKDVSMPDSVIDNRAVRMMQTRRIAAVKSRRDPEAVSRALADLKMAAQRRGDLMAATIACMRSRATVGECVRVLETVWPCFTGEMQPSAEHYGQTRADHVEWQRACHAVQQLAEDLGRAPSIHLAKLGQDGHDRGIRLIAGALVDAGFRVSIGSFFSRPHDALARASQEACDVLGISSLAGAHLDLVSELIAERDRQQLDMAIVLGGIVPEAHVHELEAAGVEAIFPPGTTIEAIVQTVVCTIRRTVPSMSRQSTVRQFL